MFGNGTNPIGATSAAANSVLVTNGSNVPSLSQTLPTQVQANITSLTGMTGLIEYPTGIIFNGTGGVGDSLNRNIGTAAGQNLTVRAGAPASGVGNVAGGNLILSSGIAEGSGISNIIFQVPDPSLPGTADNLPVTQMTLTSTALNLFTGTDLQTNGTTRISSAGAGTLTSLTLGSPLAVPSGGTGLSSIPAHSVLIGEGTSNVAAATPSTAGYVLTSNGGSSDPTWQASSGSVFSVSNSDGSLAISPTTGNVVASLAPGHANTWTATQTYNNTTSNNAALVVNNTYVNGLGGTAIGATVTSTGPSSGTNTALTLTASGGATNNALAVIAGTVNIAGLTPSVPVFTDANKNLISTPIVPPANGGTGTSTAFTPGSVIFAGAGGVYAQDNSNFFWDETNKTLTLGGSGYELPQSTISTSGNINNFLQINNQNLSNGNDASTDFVATADNGSNSNYYIDMGINGSMYKQADYDVGKGDDGYLVAQGGNLDLGAGATGDSVILFTGGNNTTNRALSIDGSQIITFSQYGAGALSTDGSGVVSSGTLTVPNGGTGLATIAAHSVILGEGTSAVAVATPSTAGYVLTSTGASSDPTWQAASGAVLSVANSDGTLTISPTTGNVVASIALGHANTWTGTQIFPLTDAQGSAFTNSLNNATTTLINGTKISGNISGNAANVTGIVALANGGTNAALTPSNGGIFYSTGTAGAILGGTATAHQVLLSGAGSAPSWSTATYPATTSANQLLYSNAANTVAGLATANNGILVTSSSGVPSIGSTLPTAVQSNITQVGTITSGVWNGTPIGPTYGGTGVNNGSNTITLGGNMNTGGAFTTTPGNAVTFTTTGTTNITLPTSGTLATTGNTVSSVGLSLPSIFTVTNSPVTSSGTLTGSLNTQTANTVFAGPSSGSAAVPTFRAMVSADYPASTINYGSIQNETKSTILGNPSGSTSAAPSEITLGAGLSFSGTTLVNTGVTTNPLTTLGDIIYASNTATPATPARLGGSTTASTKEFLTSTATAGGVAQAPAWATLASGDIPNNTANTTGSAGSFTGSLAGDVTGTQSATAIANTSAAGGHIIAALSTNAGTLTNNTSGNAANVTGIVALANGGTSAALTASNGGIFYSTSTAGAILAGTATANQILLSGASAAPSWSTNTYPATDAKGDLHYASATNAVTGLAIGSTGQMLTVASGLPAWTTATYPATTTAYNLLVSTAANVVGQVAAGTTGQVLTATTGAAPAFAANTGGWTQVTVTGSNFTTTGQTLTTITGLSFTPAISTNYEIEGWIIASSSTNAGDEFGFSSGGTSSTASIIWTAPLAATTATSVTTATSGSASTAVLTASQTNAEVFFHGFLASGTGSPSFAIEGLKTTNGTLTVLVGSTLRYRVLGQ